MNHFQIAVLIASHNRKEKTLNCLDTLFSIRLPNNFGFETFLVDDGSTDGTTAAVKSNFPYVNIIQGNGNLYWNKGMRLAWEVAAKKNDFDFYLWLNDDVLLYKDALTNLMEDYDSIDRDAVIVGVIKDPDSSKTTYGGYFGLTKLDPNGNVQECDTFNGNVVLVPKTVFETIGMLDKAYTHWFGDTDYGWRARKAGFKCYISSNYVGEGSSNPHGSDWANPNYSLLKRLKILHSPKGLPPKEWYIYSKRIYGNKWLLSFIKLYIRAIFPSIWIKLKDKI